MMEEQKHRDLFQPDVAVYGKNGEPCPPTTRARAVKAQLRGRGVLVEKEQGLALYLNYEPNPDRAQSNSPNLVRAVQPLTGEKRKLVLEALKRRDGEYCFYCFNKMNEDEISIEHLLALCNGGNNSKDNLVLAHAQCNERVDAMSVMRKIRIREIVLFRRLSKFNDNQERTQFLCERGLHFR